MAKFKCQESWKVDAKEFLKPNSKNDITILNDFRNSSLWMIIENLFICIYYSTVHIIFNNPFCYFHLADQLKIPE